MFYFEDRDVCDFYVSMASESEAEWKLNDWLNRSETYVLENISNDFLKSV